jgi:hypothetical protein
LVSQIADEDKVAMENAASTIHQAAGAKEEGPVDLDPLLLLYTVMDSQGKDAENAFLIKVEDLLRETIVKSAGGDGGSDSGILYKNMAMLLKILKMSLTKIGNDGDSEKVDVPAKPKKQIPKMKSDESVLGFYGFYKSQARS